MKLPSLHGTPRILTSAPSRQVAKLYPRPMINSDFCWYNSSAREWIWSFIFNTSRIWSEDSGNGEVRDCMASAWGFHQKKTGRKCLLRRFWINLAKRTTWQFLESLDDLLPSGLHGDSVLRHHQSKHHQGDKLTRIGLCANKEEKSHHCQALFTEPGDRNVYLTLPRLLSSSACCHGYQPWYWPHLSLVQHWYVHHSAIHDR